MLQAAVLVVLLLLMPLRVTADSWGPWETASQPQHTSTAKTNPLATAIKLFQKHISTVDGPRCPMYPTCSSYGLEAVEKHGPLLGTFLLVDRLYREQDAEQSHQQPIAKWGYIRFYDPLEENDFWLRKAATTAIQTTDQRHSLP